MTKTKEELLNIFFPTQLKMLDDYIKMIYTHKQQVRDNQETLYWEDDLHRARWLVRNIKPIAKAFGLYPYNQEKVRNP